jgi:hypothetical protein
LLAALEGLTPAVRGDAAEPATAMAAAATAWGEVAPAATLAALAAAFPRA